MSNKNICLIGGSSDLGIEVAKICKMRSDTDIHGIARSEDKIGKLYKEFLLISDYELDKEAISDFIIKTKTTDIVLLNGFIGENNRPTEKIVKINYSIPLSLIKHINKKIDDKFTFTIISTLAVSRPRDKNYVYGLSKYLLEEAVKKSKFGKFIIFRSGFIRTKMTEDHKEPPFGKNPEEVAEKIVNAILNNRKRISTVYSSIPIFLLFYAFKLVPLNILNSIERRLI